MVCLHTCSWALADREGGGGGGGAGGRFLLRGFIDSYRTVRTLSAAKNSNRLQVRMHACHYCL